MCGIVGYLNLDGSPLDPEGKALGNMCASIIHRGPDEEGKLIVGPVALGMRRLSIIDLASGQQPISNEDDSVVIVFNGEIYNFQELQAQLRARGHLLKTNSDTETIVHLYEDYGVDCVDHLEGMFAFAIWDKKLNRLFIARDRMGEKPLYWCEKGNNFIFSSELKGILSHPSAQRDLNLYAFRQFLALEYVPAPECILEGIHKLPPAHYLLVDSNGVKVERYWSLPEARDTVSDITEREAKAKLEELLTESIRLRLISEVPLGIFLSGGIDSSLITAIASRQVSHKLQTFSVSFSDPSFDESTHAETVANYLGCDHHVIPFDPQVALQSMQDLFHFL
ncbi:MAG: asparagine synthase (glutamine-hydrolyzing), partial [Cyanobacteria bacterium]|nr:asparagine synthase (glutamine-hydrolyzing) [Cyanobacteriota bacterium]